jgi:choline dehydrogenase
VNPHSPATPGGFDYVVAGGGTAGCAVARRLLERTGATVLVLEAGGPNRRADVARTDVPSVTSLWGDPEVTWPYRTAPQPGLGGREIDLPQGRGLGGGSAVNALMHVRGNAADFDGWSALGNPGWSHREVLPYFAAAETFAAGPGPSDGAAPDGIRGVAGPVQVSRYGDPAPSSAAFLRAVAELGIGSADGGPDYDYNGARQEGAAFLYQSTRDASGRRSDTATAYLRPVLDDPRLTVVTGATVVRVLLEGTRAVGVEYIADGTSRQVRADAEVIVSCGALASPGVLTRSGIGPSDELARLGVAAVAALPGVGGNLQDHLLYGLGFASLVDLPGPALIAEAGLFTGVRSASGQPDLQLLVGPVQFFPPRYQTPGPGFTFVPVLLRPHSRGRVTLRSADPFDPPIVDPCYLSRPEDLDVLVRGGELGRELAAARAFDAIRGAELAPGAGADLAEYIEQTASTVWHPVGTNAMGPGEDAVVDAELRVHGVERLRVADASVMPTITSGNTCAPTVMIAERAADLIARAAGVTGAAEPIAAGLGAGREPNR